MVKIYPDKECYDKLIENYPICKKEIESFDTEVRFAPSTVANRWFLPGWHQSNCTTHRTVAFDPGPATVPSPGNWRV